MAITKTLHAIPGYHGYHLEEVGGEFRIIGRRGRPLALSQNQHGHLFCSVYDPEKKHRIKVLYLHRAVALVFHLDEWFEGAMVDHIDNNPKHNSPSNLRWMTVSDHCRHSALQKVCRPMTDEHKAKISRANKGRKHTEETRANMKAGWV